MTEKANENTGRKTRLGQQMFGHTDNTLRQILRYVVVCAITAGVDYMLFLLLNHIGVYYLIATVLSSLCSGLVNYSISKLWVFHQQKIDNRLLEFVCFTALGAIGLAVNVFTMWLFTSIAGCDERVSKILYWFFSSCFSVVSICYLLKNKY